MINLTIDRLKTLSNIDHIFIMTNEELKIMIMKQNSELTEQNFIIEPCGKNTAPAIG